MNPNKQNELLAKMASLEIKEEDLIEKFILGSGSGGQKINKTHSCVYLKHIPSKIEIKCQKSRSREANRLFARRELCDRIEYLLFKEKSEREQKFEKIRRQKRRRSKKAQEKVLETKRHKSETKKLRHAIHHTRTD
jgi:protein subunit release factor B